MTGLIIGATGATGKALLHQLLEDADYGKVIVFLRRPIKTEHPKLIKHIVCFDDINSWKQEIQGDVLFSCLGTTLKIAGSKEKQWKIDHDYQLNVARIANENHVSDYVLVSSMGANAKSRIFYSRMKGSLEEKVHDLPFRKTIIFRPPGLIRPDSDRKGEKISVKIIQFFNALGIFRSFKPLLVSDLAKAMRNSVSGLPNGKHMITSAMIPKWFQK